MEHLLNLNNFDVIDSFQNETSILFEVRPKKEIRECPKCKSLNCYSKEKATKRIKDLPYYGKFSELEIEVRRFKCNVCNNTFYAKLDEINDKHRMTTRLVETIQKECLKDTFTAIASRHGITEGTVRRIFNSYAKELDKGWIPLAPRVLGIDECHLGHKARSVFIDVRDNGSAIIEMGKNIKQKTIVKILESLKQPENVEVVTMDMTRSYREAVQMVLPKATIVVDKFHVIKQLMDATDTAFRAVRESMKEGWGVLPIDQQREIHARFRALRVSVQLFRKNEEELLDDDRKKLAVAFEMDDNFRKVYYLKENFRDILNKRRDKEAAERAFCDWECSIPDDPEFDSFRNFVRTVYNWHDYIFNYFDFRESNAATEAINGTIKLANKIGRGYSIEVIRTKVLHKPVCKNPPKYIRPEKTVPEKGLKTFVVSGDGSQREAILVEGSSVNINALLLELEREPF